MNKITYIIIALSIAFFSCQTSKSNYRKEDNAITVSIDDRVELFRVAYILAIEDSIEANLRPCKTDFYYSN